MSSFFQILGEEVGKKKKEREKQLITACEVLRTGRKKEKKIKTRRRKK